MRCAGCAANQHPGKGAGCPLPVAYFVWFRCGRRCCGQLSLSGFPLCRAKHPPRRLPAPIGRWIHPWQGLGPFSVPTARHSWPPRRPAAAERGCHPPPCGYRGQSAAPPRSGADRQPAGSGTVPGSDFQPAAAPPPKRQNKRRQAVFPHPCRLDPVLLTFAGSAPSRCPVGPERRAPGHTRCHPAPAPCRCGPQCFPAPPGCARYSWSEMPVPAF